MIVEQDIRLTAAVVPTARGCEIDVTVKVARRSDIT
jgi:hypothetical protein